MSRRGRVPAVLVPVALAFAAFALLSGAKPAPSPSADVAITKTASPTSVKVGDQLTYTLKVNNLGTAAATSVTVTDVLPASVTFVRASDSCATGTYQVGRVTVVCALGDIGSGQSVTVQVVVKPNQSGQLKNTASVATTAPDSKKSNDSDSVTVRVGKANAATPACAGTPATIVDPAGSQNGTIIGTPQRDVIVGLGGNDMIRAIGGGDLVCGGPGNDLIVGGRGADTLRGGGGDDVLRGGAASDGLFGGAGNDTLNGGPGRDTCRGGPGTNRLVRC